MYAEPSLVTLSPHVVLARLSGAPEDVAREAITSLDANLGATPVARFAAYHADEARRVFLIAAAYSTYERCVRAHSTETPAAFIETRRVCRVNAGTAEVSALLVATTSGFVVVAIEETMTLARRGLDEEEESLEDARVTRALLRDLDGDAVVEVVLYRSDVVVAMEPEEASSIEEARGMTNDELEGRSRRSMVTIFDLDFRLRASCRGDVNVNPSTCMTPATVATRPRRRRR